MLFFNVTIDQKLLKLLLLSVIASLKEMFLVIGEEGLKSSLSKCWLSDSVSPDTTARTQKLLVDQGCPISEQNQVVFLTGNSLTTRFSWFSGNSEFDLFRSEANPFYLHWNDFKYQFIIYTGPVSLGVVESGQDK